MTAEHYLKEKERLSQSMNGQDRLMDAVKDLRGALAQYGLDLMPETAFDVMCFTMETIHLDKLNLSQYAL